jgi:adenylate cyclase
LAAAERALSLNPHLAEAHAAKARALTRRGRYDEALREIEIALRLDPDSYEVNEAAAGWHYSQRRFREAISYWEKAIALVETASAGTLLSCYKAVGDADGARRAAQLTLERAEKSVAVEPDNGSAISHMVAALAALGEAKRAKEWVERALQLDPDNLNMRYNFACTLVLELHEHEAALDLLEPLLTKAVIEAVTWMKTDPDLDAIRAHPRFVAMLAAAEARLADSTA